MSHPPLLLVASCATFGEEGGEDIKGRRRLRPSAKNAKKAANILLFMTLLAVTSWNGIVEGGRHRIGMEKGHGNKFALRFSQFSLVFERPLLLLPSSMLLPQPCRSQADTTR
ncbi:hypothetical protein BHE74_00019144 [Ensete ventricosum]|nr:hypothetical protein BHE74_00019144 [Ensete ventricosum]